MASPLKVLILGATSGIAEATARLYAAEGAAILLAGRNATRLSQIEADLKLRGATQAEIAEVDLVETDTEATLAEMTTALGGIDHVLIAYGIMTDHSEAESNLAKAERMMTVNFTSTARWALAAANLLERQGHGSLVVLGSPAGDRGRRKNYVYGATKAAVATLVQGIAHRFAGKGPRAVLVKPGPTATAMTAGMNQKGMATPEQVARVIRRAADKGGPIQYAPAKWRLIMRIVREIPSPIFDRLNF
jgi:decaprenylphospho-beta-D-erythro-pentofuranosid-2-ulose 2-reductase